MIIAYTGKLGMGKTYTMTKDIVKELNKGTKVYSNYKINWYGYEEKRRWWKSLLIWSRLRRRYDSFPSTNLSYWSEIDEILDLTDGIVAIDEGSVYLNSRNWSLLDPEFQRKILQSRKDGLHIYFTAQRIGQIDITLRNLVNVFYVSTYRSIFGFGFFVLGIYEIDNNGDINEEDRLGIRVIRLRKKVQMYDTNEKIASVISTMANYARQFGQREQKLASIRKYKIQIDAKLREQGIDITVDEILKLAEDRPESVRTIAATPVKVEEKPADKAVSMLNQLPPMGKNRQSTTRTLKVKPA